MMKRKILYSVSLFAFIAITQLLFFWLVPTSSSLFAAIYPFYTCLTLVHTMLFYYICNKYKYPACFPFALSGSLIVLAQIVASLLMGVLGVKQRTAIFVEGIVVAVYILISALFIGIASKESITSEEQIDVVIQYPTSTHNISTPKRRSPVPVPHNDDCT